MFFKNFENREKKVEFRKLNIFRSIFARFSCSFFGHTILHFDNFSSRHLKVPCDRQKLRETVRESKDQSVIKVVIVVPLVKKKYKKYRVKTA